MTPTLGRIVLYRIADEKEVELNGGSDVCAAVVVRVHGTACVNLRLLLDGDPEDGNTFPRKTYVVCEEGRKGCWSWPLRVGS